MNLAITYVTGKNHLDQLMMYNEDSELLIIVMIITVTLLVILIGELHLYLRFR